MMRKAREAILDEISERKIAVEICTSHQEKEFRAICRQSGEELVRKDDTAYREISGKKKPIYPTYYAFHKIGDRRTTWWTNDLEVVYGQNYLRIGFDSFREIIGR